MAVDLVGEKAAFLSGQVVGVEDGSSNSLLYKQLGINRFNSVLYSMN